MQKDLLFRNISAVGHESLDFARDHFDSYYDPVGDLEQEKGAIDFSMSTLFASKWLRVEMAPQSAFGGNRGPSG
jgi:hypothetical protein